jgi:hypothetical protein
VLLLTEGIGLLLANFTCSATVRKDTGLGKFSLLLSHLNHGRIVLHIGPRGLLLQLNRDRIATTKVGDKVDDKVLTYAPTTTTTNLKFELQNILGTRLTDSATTLDILTASTWFYRSWINS